MPPLPKHPEARQRGKRSTTAATLPATVDHEVPPLPDTADWLTTIESSGAGVEWPVAVQEWWSTIWQSPMSAEFLDSDHPQLYLAAFYLAQAVDPALKMSERLAAGRQHEGLIKNFGLSPMARRSLQWEIEKVSEAQERAAHRGRPGEAPRAPATGHRPDPRNRADEDDADNPFTRKRLEREAAER